MIHLMPSTNPPLFQAVRIFPDIAFLIGEAMILAATKAILATS